MRLWAASLSVFFSLSLLFFAVALCWAQLCVIFALFEVCPLWVLCSTGGNDLAKLICQSVLIGVHTGNTSNPLRNVTSRSVSLLVEQNRAYKVWSGRWISQREECNGVLLRLHSGKKNTKLYVIWGWAPNPATKCFNYGRFWTFVGSKSHEAIVIRTANYHINMCQS